LKAIILAAGRGSRLGDLGSELPKCLLSINGQSSLERYRRAFDRAGIVKEVIVVGGYRIDLMRERLPAGFRLIENDRFATTNSLYSLWLALESAGDGEDIAVVHGDVVYEPDLLGRFLRTPRRNALLVDELKPFDGREYHVRVADGRVRALSNRLPEHESAGEDAQTFKVARESLAMIREFARHTLENGGEGHYGGHVLTALIEKGLLQPVYTNQQFWSEFDTADDYRRCSEQVAGMDDRLPVFPGYGTDGHSQAAQPARESPNGDGSGPRSALRLGRSLVRSLARAELPWRLRWIPEYASGLRHSPRRALRLFPVTANGSLSRRGLWLQLYGHEMLRAVMAAAEEVGIKPFLLWGTLLGYVRDGGLIFNDHDVDMGLLDADFRRVPELKERMLARGYSVRLHLPGKISFRHPRIEWLWLDIDRLREMRDHLWSMSPSEDDPVTFAYGFSRESFASLERRTLEGVEVYVPVGAEEVLETIYGTWSVREEKKEDWLRGPANLTLWKPADSRRWAEQSGRY